MIVVVLISILSFFLTFLSSNGRIKYGMEIGFILVTIVAAIHYNYGNDYKAYYSLFNNITKEDFSWQSISSKEIYKDPGWAIICFIFKPFKENGFFVMVAVLNILQNWIYYSFIKKNVPQKDWHFAVFIYLFTFSFYALNMSMMRQGLAISLFVLMLPLIQRKKTLPALLLALVAYSVHSSAIIIIPFAFFGYIRMVRTERWAFFFGFFFLILLVAGDFVGSIYSNLAKVGDFEEFDNNYRSIKLSNNGIGLGFILIQVPFMVSIYYLLKQKHTTPDQRKLIVISCFGSLIVPFGLKFHLIDRMGLYFNAYNIAAIPFMYGMINNKVIKIGITCLYAFFTLWSYWNAFTGETYAMSYGIFKTIFP